MLGAPAATSPLAERLASALAGRYAVEREVGAGGMATVYLARDLRHGRRVAIKVLREELAAAVGAERFLEEIRVTASLQHPHILPLFDSGERGRRAVVRRCRSSRARRCARGSRASGGCRWTPRCGSRARWRTRSSTRTRTASCTAT